LGWCETNATPKPITLINPSPCAPAPHRLSCGHGYPRNP
jgi:hypothetical protein